MAVHNITLEKTLEGLRQESIDSIKIMLDYWPKEDHHAEPVVGDTLEALEEILKQHQGNFLIYHQSALDINVSYENGDIEYYIFTYQKNGKPRLTYNRA